MSTDNLYFLSLPQNGTEERIVRAIREHSPISRARIAQTAGLPNAAVSRGVARLLERHLVLQMGLADRTGPRAKKGLQLNAGAGHVLAVEYRCAGLRGVAVDAAYGCICSEVNATSLANVAQEDKIAVILAFIRALSARVTADHGPCLGLALVDPGVVDTAAGRTVKCTTLDQWTDVPIVERVQGEFSLPTMLLNSMTAGVHAIDRIELGGACHDLVFVEYGEGIACGLKIGGRYAGGHSGLGGELGHLRVTDRPVSCACGAVGCLEAVAALPALARNAREALSANSSSSLAGSADFDGRDVLRATADGDRLALRVVEQAFEYVGRTIAGMVNVLDPEAVVLDPLFAEAGDEAVASLRRAYERTVSMLHGRAPELSLSTLSDQLCALGGAAAVLDHCWAYRRRCDRCVQQHILRDDGHLIGICNRDTDDLACV